MDDASQIHIPESFIRLYTRPEQPVPRALAASIAQRFEVCDDLAGALVPRAQELLFKLGITEADVIDKLLESLMALTGEGGVLSEAEARWVVGHTAEQLGWLDHLSEALKPPAPGGAR